MATLGHQTLQTATASNNTAGAIVRVQWQPARAESSEGAGSVSYGGNLRRQVVALSSSFHELPLLRLHVRGLPVSKFLSSCGKLCTKWHWTGFLGFNRRSPRNRTARKGDDSGSSSEEDRKDNETVDEQHNSKGEEQGADSQESGGEISEVSREEAEAESGEGSGENEADDNETSLQNDQSKKDFWRKIWEPGQKNEDNTLAPEEELLLQDLESLRFDWKGLLDPSWENLLALGFTALLTLALLKILSQLVVVVITIFISALKYSVLAALLLGLLIFLL